MKQNNTNFDNLIPTYLLNSNQYSICIINLEGNYTFVNKYFKDKYEFDDEFVGKPFSVTIHPDDISVCNAAAVECLINHDKIVPVRIRKPVACKINEYYWTTWEFSAFKNENNQLLGIFCIGSDITENEMNIIAKERYLYELIQSENKLKAILDSSTSSNLLISPDYKILSFNKATYYFIKSVYQREIKKGDSIHLYVLPDTKKEFDSDFQKALNGEYIETEKELFFQNGESIWAKVNYAPVYDNQNKLIGVSFNSLNITEQKKALLKIKLQNELLKDIAWQQSHEVRSPVATILGLVNLLQGDKNASIEDIELYLKYLHTAAEHLDKIIHDIVGKINYLDA